MALRTIYLKKPIDDAVMREYAERSLAAGGTQPLPYTDQELRELAKTYGKRRLQELVLERSMAIVAYKRATRDVNISQIIADALAKRYGLIA